MAYVQPFTSVTMNGTTAGGNEIWSAGFHVDSVDGPLTGADWRAVWNEVGDDVASLIASTYSSGALMTPADTYLTSVKVANLGTDGKYLEEALEFPVTAQGSLNSGYAPQVALVTTLQSSRFKDPGKYNRFYLPISAGGLGGTWRLTSANQADYATAMQVLMNGINSILETAVPAGSYQVSVVSSSGSGFTGPAIALRVGQIFDTQRRRRNKLPESYITRGLATN